MNSPNDPLDRLLNAWKDVPGSETSLEKEVWRRIARSEEAEASRNVFAVFEGWFSRPPFAALFILTCVLLGLFLAEMRVAKVQQHRSTQLARSYLKLIDPLLQDQGRQP